MTARARARLAACLAWALILCVPFASRGADVYEIDAILPQTGNGAFLGKTIAAALGVLQDVINKKGGIGGRPVKFVVLDDQSNPQTAVQLTNGVLAKKPPVILGSVLVALCNAEAPLAKDGPVIYCFSPGIHPPAGSYMFTAGPSTTDTLAASVRYLRGRGWTKVALITSTDATGQDADQNFEAVFALPENKNEQIVAHEHFNTTDLGVEAQMTHIKSSGAQAVIMWSTGTPLGTLLRGAVESGLQIPVLASPGNITYAQMKQYLNILPKEIYFPGSAAYAVEQLPDGAMKRAVKTYLDAFSAAGIRPDQGHLFTWDPVLMLVDALNKLGTDAPAARIKDFINGYRGIGVFGRYDFHAVPQRGIGVDSVIVVRWDPAKDTWVGVSRSGGAPLR